MPKKKIISSELIIKKISELCIETCCSIEPSFVKLIEKEKSNQHKSLNRKMLELFLENNHIAKQKNIPVCQDTGICTYYIEIGEDVKIKGTSLTECINRGTAEGYVNGYLRKSVVLNPVKRKPLSPDNTPVFIYTEIVKGDQLKIYFLPKGGGSENVSVIRMMSPSSEIEDIENFIIESVRITGSKACPPYKLGICIGGTFDYCAMYSKKILIDEFADNTDFTKKFSEKILKKVNQLNIGPQGIGGSPTAVKANIKLLPTHIAMLPVALNISCNAVRWGKIIL
jgi:fumarate hydratase subunit alpha